MKQLLFEIKIRFGKNFSKTLWGLLKLYFDKAERKNFFDKRNNEDQNCEGEKSATEPGKCFSVASKFLFVNQEHPIKVDE